MYLSVCYNILNSVLLICHVPLLCACKPSDTHSVMVFVSQYHRFLALSGLKKHINMAMINLKMDHTFPLRRREIIEDAPLVFQIKDRWPGLFLEQQVSQLFPHI